VTIDKNGRCVSMVVLEHVDRGRVVLMPPISGTNESLDRPFAVATHRIFVLASEFHGRSI